MGGWSSSKFVKSTVVKYSCCPSDFYVDVAVIHTYIYMYIYSTCCFLFLIPSIAWEELLNNIFQPLFEVALDPAGRPKMGRWMKLDFWQLVRLRHEKAEWWRSRKTESIVINRDVNEFHFCISKRMGIVTPPIPISEILSTLLWSS